MDLEAVVNFRDFGGAATREGGKVRRGLLYRSGHFGEASQSDQARIASLAPVAYVDLRRAIERQRFPTRRAPSCSATIVTRDDSSGDAEPPHLSFLAEADLTRDRLDARFREVYRGFVQDPTLQRVFRAGFATLDDADRPVIIHCHAGKDRTGVLVALMQHVLGVERDAVIEDYLLTNRHNRLEARLAPTAARFEADHGFAPDADLLRFVLGAHVEGLLAAFDEMDTAYGGMDGYLDAVLQVTPEMRERLVARLVEYPQPATVDRAGQ